MSKEDLLSKEDTLRSRQTILSLLEWTVKETLSQWKELQYELFLTDIQINAYLNQFFTK